MKSAIITFMVALSFSACAQGTFQNLNFEAADVSGYSPGSLMPTTSAFPDWQAFYGSTSTAQVGYDYVSTGSPAISIIDNYPSLGLVPIQGNYSAYLESALIGIQSTSVSLSQTGLVPVGAESIQLDAQQEQGSSFVVTLGGETITMVPLQAFANYTMYAGNISAWAGQDATLTITDLAPANQEYSPNFLELDDISFFTQAVPEPGPFALTCLAGALFAAYRRLAPKRK